MKIHLIDDFSTDRGEIEVKSEAAIAETLQSIAKNITNKDLANGIRAIVTDKEGIFFKDFNFVKNPEGKIEVKEVYHRPILETEKARKGQF